jgi:hypothetical protein
MTLSPTCSGCADGRVPGNTQAQGDPRTRPGATVLSLLRCAITVGADARVSLLHPPDNSAVSPRTRAYTNAGRVTGGGERPAPRQSRSSRSRRRRRLNRISARTCFPATAGRTSLFPGLCSSEGRRRRHRTAGASLDFASCATGRDAGHPGVMSDRSRALLFRGRRSGCLLDPG